MSEEAITYEVRGKAAIITFNLPKALNALTNEQYVRLGKLVEEADAEEDTVMTLIQSTGRYFSAGANFADKAFTEADMSSLFTHEFWFGRLVGRNVWLTDIFLNHKKILVAAVNGPVIGLSTGLLALCDLIYVKDEKDFFLSAPFASLGLVAEGASSSTLFLRLGWSLASEALLLGKRISGKDLTRVGFINRSFDGQFKTTEEFNEYIYNMTTDHLETLHEDSIFKMKQLLKANRAQLVQSANSSEIVQLLGKWIEGVPQAKFAELNQRSQRKNKM
jgi:peroxisomal 3,2-trans-enoyl-CoA isomerase